MKSGVHVGWVNAVQAVVVTVEGELGGGGRQVVLLRDCPLSGGGRGT